MKKKVLLRVLVIAVLVAGTAWYLFMNQTKTACAQDKTTQDFALLLKEKYLPDLKPVPQKFKESFKANTGIIEQTMIMNETFNSEEVGYGYNVTKFISHEKAIQNTLDFQNSSYAIVEGGYAIIPTSSAYDKSPAFQKIKAAWKEFCH